VCVAVEVVPVIAEVHFPHMVRAVGFGILSLLFDWIVALRCRIDHHTVAVAGGVLRRWCW
jgi:hypothetical protein